MKIGIPILMLSLAFLSPNVNAVNVGGIEVPDKINDLQLKGAGLLRKGLFFKVYVGALYTNTNGTQRLDIHYCRNIPKKWMIQIAEKTLQQNLTAEEYQRHLPTMEKLHHAYLDGKIGSVASIVVTPGEGLLYAYDNQPIITFPDDGFAAAYLKIWLGENPSSINMKKALLNLNHE